MNNPMKYKLENGTATFIGCNPKPTGALIIPDTIDGFPVTSVSNFAFSGCDCLTSVTIPDSVTVIGIGAFGGCSRLTSVTIPNSVAEIDDYAFYGCASLISITIPNSVTFIGYLAFQNHTVVTRETL